MRKAEQLFFFDFQSARQGGPRGAHGSAWLIKGSHYSILYLVRSSYIYLVDVCTCAISPALGGSHILQWWESPRSIFGECLKNYSDHPLSFPILREWKIVDQLVESWSVTGKYKALLPRVQLQYFLENRIFLSLFYEEKKRRQNCVMF